MKKSVLNDRRIDNELYNAEGDCWWQPDSPLHLLQSSVNPARTAYFERKMTENHIDPKRKAALDIGCGGGCLSEELARIGFDVCGIDPSELSLRTAKEHARRNDLTIRYEKGIGEALPYRDGSMDIVFCCDVLEHVRDVRKVISEISRVLKPGGFFFYDTLNRTLLSRMVAINISQEWKRWAYAPPHIHDWSMFIQPKELISILSENHLRWMDHVGMWPNVRLAVMLRLLRERVKGDLTYRELGEKIRMVERGDRRMMYMGYARKEGGEGQKGVDG